VAITAQSRSAGHAMNCQLFTFPRGNPGEVQPEPAGKP
jgi:hypothetical protein